MAASSALRPVFALAASGGWGRLEPIRGTESEGLPRGQTWRDRAQQTMSILWIRPLHLVRRHKFPLDPLPSHVDSIFAPRLVWSPSFVRDDLPTPTTSMLPVFSGGWANGAMRRAAPKWLWLKKKGTKMEP